MHEKLYQGGAAGSIDLRDYLQDLLSTVFASFASREVGVESRIPGIKVGSESAAPWFRIVIQQDGDDCVLTVSNSGRPFPDGVDFDNPETLGLQLVRALAAQLGGESGTAGASAGHLLGTVRSGEAPARHSAARVIL